MDSKSSSDSEGEPEAKDPLANRSSHAFADADDQSVISQLDTDNMMPSMYNVLMPYHVPGRHKLKNYASDKTEEGQDDESNYEQTDATDALRQTPAISISSFDMISMSTGEVGDGHNLLEGEEKQKPYTEEVIPATLLDEKESTKDVVKIVKEEIISMSSGQFGDDVDMKGEETQKTFKEEDDLETLYDEKEHIQAEVSKSSIPMAVVKLVKEEITMSSENFGHDLDLEGEETHKPCTDKEDPETFLDEKEHIQAEVSKSSIPTAVVKLVEEEITMSSENVGHGLDLEGEETHKPCKDKEDSEMLLDEKEHIQAEVSKSSIPTTVSKADLEDIANNENQTNPPIPQRRASSMVQGNTIETKVIRSSSDSPPVTTTEPSEEDGQHIPFSLGTNKTPAATDKSEFVKSNNVSNDEKNSEYADKWEHSFDNAMDIEETHSFNHDEKSIDTETLHNAEDKNEEDNIETSSYPPNSILVTDTMMADINTEERSGNAESQDSVMIGYSFMEDMSSLPKIQGNTAETTDDGNEVFENSFDSDDFENSFDSGNDEYHSLEGVENNEETGNNNSNADDERSVGDEEDDTNKFKTSLTGLSEHKAVDRPISITDKESHSSNGQVLEIEKGSESASSSVSRQSSGASFIVLEEDSARGSFKSISSSVSGEKLVETDSFSMPSKTGEEELRKQYATDNSTEMETDANPEHQIKSLTDVTGDLSFADQSMDLDEATPNCETDLHMIEVEIPTSDDKGVTPPPVPPRSMQVFEPTTSLKNSDNKDTPPRVPPRTGPSSMQSSSLMQSVSSPVSNTYQPHANLRSMDQPNYQTEQMSQFQQQQIPNIWSPSNLTAEQLQLYLCMFNLHMQQQQTHPFPPPTPSAPPGHGLNLNPTNSATKAHHEQQQKPSLPTNKIGKDQQSGNETQKPSISNKADTSKQPIKKDKDEVDARHNRDQASRDPKISSAAQVDRSKGFNQEGKHKNIERSPSASVNKNQHGNQTGRRIYNVRNEKQPQGGSKVTSNVDMGKGKQVGNEKDKKHGSPVGVERKPYPTGNDCPKPKPRPRFQQPQDYQKRQQGGGQKFKTEDIKTEPTPKPKPEKKVKPSQCYFYVCRMNPKTMKEDLINYLEAGLVGDVSIVGEKVIHDRENSQALIVFSQKPDMEKLHEKLAKRQIEGAHLKGEEVNPPTYIAVSCENTFEKPGNLELYFESERIGGGIVKNQIEESEDGSCFILGFDDTAVVERLCYRQEKHRFENQDLRVSPCYKFEGGAIWDHEIHLIPKAEPIELSHPAECLRFLKRCCFKELKTRVEENYGILDIRASSLYVTCTLTPKVSDFKRIIRAWPMDMKAAINTYICKNVTEKSIRLAKEPEVWSKLIDSFISADEDNLNIWRDDAGKVIHLTGSLNEVESKHNEALQIIKDIRRELQRTTDARKFNESKLAVLEAMGVMNEIRSRYDDTKMTLDQGTLTVEGQHDDNLAVFSEIYERFDSVSEHYKHHRYSKNCFKFVKNHKGIMSKLREAVKSKDFKAEWDLLEGELVVYIPSEVELSDVTKLIFSKISEKKSFKLDEEMEKVLDTYEWTKFSEETSESYDDVYYDCAEGVLEVYGYAENVMIVESLVKEFLDKNTVRKQVMKMDQLTVQFITKHRKAAVDAVGQSNDVDVELDERQAVIKITGKKAGLIEAKKSLAKIRDAVISDKHEIQKVGVQSVYVSERERGTIDTIERETSCLITSLLDDNVSESPQTSDQYADHETQSSRGAMGGNNSYEDDEEGDEEDESDNKTFKCKNGITIYQVLGEIGYQAADILVASCSSNLDLKLGGAAKSLLLNAGRQLQDELKASHKEIKNGEIVILKGYQLECSSVIFTSLPNWTSERNCSQLIQNFMAGCLQALVKKRKRSIMFSAMGTGQLKYPHARVAAMMYQAVIDFDSKTPHSTVEEVKFVIYPKDNQTIQAFESEVRLLKDGGGTRPSLNVKLNNIDVEMVVEDIAFQKVDAILCSTSDKFDLSKSGAAAALLKTGGSALQVGADAFKQGGLSSGQVGKIAPGKLQCKAVFLTVLPSFSEENKSVLADAVKSFLNSSNMEKFTSVAIPAIGTGFLKYPKAFVSKTMVDAVYDWSINTPNSTVKSVRFVMHAKDSEVIESFTVQIKNRQGGNARRLRSFVRSNSRTDETKSANCMLKSGCQIGPIKLTVKIGDIIDEDTDAIISSLGKPCEFLGAVAQTLLKKCPKMKEACIRKKAKLEKSGIICTKSEGSLKAGHVIHVHFQESLNNWQKYILKCLEKAKEKNFKSLAFPVLGTGQGTTQQQPEDIAACMFDAIAEFVNKNTRFKLKDLRIVIFHKQSSMKDSIMGTLEDRMKNKKDSKWLFGKVKVAYNRTKEFFTNSKSKDEPKDEKEASSLLLTIYSDSKDNIDKCKAALDAKLDGIYIHKKIESYKETVQNLTKEELDNVEKTTSLVNIKTDKASGIITVYGPQRNVTTADSEIQNKLRANERKKNLAKEAKMLYTIVKWHHEDITPTQVNLEAYDETSNQVIETAYKDNKPQVKLHDTGGEIYVINFKDMIEYPESDKNDTVRVIRKDIIKAGDINLPKTWDVMGDQENMKMVNLSPTDAEYKQVESKFITGAKTGAFQNRIPNVQNIAVTKIERIQNRALYQQYMAKKTQIEGAKPTLPPNMPLERILWHGTAQAAVTSIQKHGFNRSYCGKNGTWFGGGVYFAEDASYSARPWLAVGVQNPPNPPGQNKGYIFMCKVLTGQYTLGNPNMRYLPAVDAAKDPTLMYDSAVDKLANPVEFVIFHDTQAYPEYIITFNL